MFARLCQAVMKSYFVVSISGITFSNLVILQQAFGAANKHGDLFGFGRLFVANPDLPERIRHSLPLNDVDPATMYGGTDKGYEA